MNIFNIAHMMIKYKIKVIEQYTNTILRREWKNLVKEYNRVSYKISFGRHMGLGRK